MLKRYAIPNPIYCTHTIEKGEIDGILYAKRFQFSKQFHDLLYCVSLCFAFTHRLSEQGSTGIASSVAVLR